MKPSPPLEPHPFSKAYPNAWNLVKDTVLSRVGNTPLYDFSPLLSTYLPRSRVKIYGKMEGYNPGGSVKDRPALSMILGALEKGELVPGKKILDSTSGNTGIAYAMIGAVLHIPVKLCIPLSASEERIQTLLAFGAELVFTDPLEGSDGAIRVCDSLYRKEKDLYYKPDQYNNPLNPFAHEITTAPEIYYGTEGKVTHVIATLGTSGTAMGIKEWFRKMELQVKVIGVEPDQAFHGIEGLKHMETSIVPGIYRRELLDEKIQVSTEEAYEMVRIVASKMGILVGPSGGAGLWGALKIGKNLKEGEIVVIIPDNGNRYLSTHVWEDLAKKKEKIPRIFSSTQKVSKTKPQENNG